MKTKAIGIAVFFATFLVLAWINYPFPGWNRLEEISPDIIIAHCGKPTPPTPGVLVMNAPTSDSEIQILSVLKGTNGIASARLETDHDLKEGENYLVFGGHDGGIYQADDTSVIPLGTNFSTNSIAGKPLNEQLQILFKQRVDDLNRQIQNDEKEKQRLEEGLTEFSGQ